MKKYTKIIATVVFAVVCIVSFSEAWAEEIETLSSKQKNIIPIAAFTASGTGLN